MRRTAVGPAGAADGVGLDPVVLSDEQFQRLAGYGRDEHVEEGRVLYASGDVSYDFFLLRTATVRAVRSATAIEPERVVHRRGPGDFLGELSLLTGQHVFLTIQVETAGTVVRIDAAQLRRVLAEQVDIADVLIETFRARRERMRAAAGSVLEIVGRADASETLELRSYAGQMLLPHAWLDATSTSGQALIRATSLGEDDLPAAMAEGRVLRRATPTAVAEALGLAYRPGAGVADLVVVGAGPAGLAAAVYAASEGLATVLVDRTGIGGQAAKSARIENYLGFPEGVSGEGLTRLAMLQALKFGVKIFAPCAAVGLDLSDDRTPTVELQDGTRIAARAVLAATGARYRRLRLPRWTEFEHVGCIRYAATELDVRGFEAEPVTVVGGANSAGQAALSLAGRGSLVTLVVRGPDLRTRMSAYLTDRIRAHPRIRVRIGSTVGALSGDGTLSAIGVDDADGCREQLACRALFCFIGADPVADWLRGVATDDAGFVLTDSRLPAVSGATALPYQTSAGRVFAVGDLRSGSTKRVATAVGEGAGAVSSVHLALASR
jgi:thioredoxin reductase (NADPH)